MAHSIPWSEVRSRGRGLLGLLLLVVVGGGIFAVLCDGVGDKGGATSVDPSVATWFAAHRTVTEAHLGVPLAEATSPMLLVALSVVAALTLLWRRRRLDAAVLLGSVTLAYAIGAVAKFAEHRARPAAPTNLVPETEPSFPSGHVLILGTVVFVVLVLSWHDLGRGGRVIASALAVVATTVEALDRLLLGAHWLTDVLASVALVTAIAAATAAVYTVVRRRPDLPAPVRGA